MVAAWQKRGERGGHRNGCSEAVRSSGRAEQAASCVLVPMYFAGLLRSLSLFMQASMHCGKGAHSIGGERSAHDGAPTQRARGKQRRETARMLNIRGRRTCDVHCLTFVWV